MSEDEECRRVRPVGSLTHRELSAEMEHVAVVIGRGGIATPEARYRAAALLRRAAKLLPQEPPHDR